MSKVSKRSSIPSLSAFALPISLDLSWNPCQDLKYLLLLTRIVRWLVLTLTCNYSPLLILIIIVLMSPTIVKIFNRLLVIGLFFRLIVQYKKSYS